MIYTYILETPFICILIKVLDNYIDGRSICMNEIARRAQQMKMEAVSN
jgi:hypothetical protein